MPSDAQAATQQPEMQKAQIDNDITPVTINVSGSAIHIKNAPQAVLEVYNLAGVKVHTQKIESSDKTIDLNNLPKGYYLVKVDKVTRKVYLK